MNFLRYCQENNNNVISLLLLLSLTLEWSSTKGCVFSVEDLNIANKITFKYRMNTKETKGEFKIQTIGKCVYFIVYNEFSTGYHYEFELRSESSNGEIALYGFEILSLRGKLLYLYSCCSKPKRWDYK